MQTYGHYEFEELQKDEENQHCFDCNKVPAHWASVNNAIYLCLICAGEHRGYGVSVSYIRSITIDTWNDNQINMMKFGGSRNLKELLDVYQINKSKVDKKVLYNSRLLDFYRKHLKSKVNREVFDKEPPHKDEALKSLSIDYNPTSSIGHLSKIKQDQDKFKSVSSDSKEEESDSGFIGGLNNWMDKAMNSTIFIANKVGEMEIGSKIMTTGNAITETGSTIVTRGTELSKSEKVTSFAKNVNSSINFFVNKIFGGGKKNDTTITDNVNNTNINSNETHNINENAKIDLNNNVKFEKGNK